MPENQYKGSQYRTIHRQLIETGTSQPEHAMLLLDEQERLYHFVYTAMLSVLPVDDQSVVLLALFNYYQRLITPPIVAASQFIFNTDHKAIKQTRSLPGLGKITRRTPLKFCTVKGTQVDQQGSRLMRLTMLKTAPPLLLNFTHVKNKVDPASVAANARGAVDEN